MPTLRERPLISTTVQLGNVAATSKGSCMDFQGKIKHTCKLAKEGSSSNARHFVHSPTRCAHLLKIKHASSLVDGAEVL